MRVSPRAWMMLEGENPLSWLSDIFLEHWSTQPSAGPGETETGDVETEDNKASPDITWSDHHSKLHCSSSWRSAALPGNSLQPPLTDQSASQRE